jgi:Diacylglycerol kinase catalytic domain
MSFANDISHCPAESTYYVVESTTITDDTTTASTTGIDTASKSSILYLFSSYAADFLSRSRLFWLPLDQLVRRAGIKDTWTLISLLVATFLIYRAFVALLRLSSNKQNAQPNDCSENKGQKMTRRRLLPHRVRSQPNLLRSLNDEMQLSQGMDNDDDENDVGELNSPYYYNQKNFSYCSSPSMDWDFQTEEERFQRLWPAQSKSLCKYSKLVLPPTCRRIASMASTAPLSTKNIASTTTLNRTTVMNDEDNPAKRIQNYLTQLFSLIRSIIFFDFRGVGRILTYWLQTWQHIREYRQSSFRSTLSDDKDHNPKVLGDDLVACPNPSSTSTVEGTVTDIPKEMTTTAGHEGDIPSSSSSLRCLDKLNKARISSYFVEEKKEISSNEVREDYHNFGKDETSNFEAEQHCDISSKEDLQQLEQDDSFRSIAPSNSDISRLRHEVCGLPEDLNESSKWEDIHQVHSDVAPGKEQKLLGPLHTQPDTELQTSFSISSKVGLDNISLVEPVQEELNCSHVTPKRWNTTKPGDNSRQQSLAHFFDTADSQAAMRQQSLEVLVPDRHGYILSEQYLPDPRNDTPLLVFVNSRSGPQQGHILIAQLRRLLNPIQVWDLADGAPESILESFSIFTGLRILVCGGDGTVAWIISALEKLHAVQCQKYENSKFGDLSDAQPAQSHDGETSQAGMSSDAEEKPRRRWPPIAILPLGTGNDLARIHGQVFNANGHWFGSRFLTILFYCCPAYDTYSL